MRAGPPVPRVSVGPGWRGLCGGHLRAGQSQAGLPRGRPESAPGRRLSAPSVLPWGVHLSGPPGRVPTGFHPAEGAGVGSPPLPLSHYADDPPLPSELANLGFSAPRESSAPPNAHSAATPTKPLHFVVWGVSV